MWVEDLSLVELLPDPKAKHARCYSESSLNEEMVCQGQGLFLSYFVGVWCCLAYVRPVERENPPTFLSLNKYSRIHGWHFCWLSNYKSRVCVCAIELKSATGWWWTDWRYVVIDTRHDWHHYGDPLPLGCIVKRSSESSPLKLPPTIISRAEYLLRIYHPCLPSELVRTLSCCSPYFCPPLFTWLGKQSQPENTLSASPGQGCCICSTVVELGIFGEPWCYSP